MKRYGNLFEKILSFENLLAAAKKALKGKKEKPRVAHFYFNLEKELLSLQEEMLTKTYKPRPLRIIQIREPKLREIGVVDFRDRVVHHAIFNIIEPILDRSFIYHSYASRKGKGTHRAIKQAQKFSRKYHYYLKCDIRKYFPSIDHQILKNIIARKFKDQDLIWILEVIIDSYNSESKKGIPIGSLTSQHFANLYLDKLDHYIKDTLGVKSYLRYTDDFVLFSNSKTSLHLLHSEICAFLQKELKLELKEEATIIAPVSEGIPFLGFRIFPNIIRIKNENKKRLIRKMKSRNKEFMEGKISNEKYSQSLNSMTEHLKVGNTYHLRKDIFHKMFL